MAITQQTANEIFANHPTRFRSKEKEALRETLKSKFKAMGYSDSEINEIDASGKNLVIGDPRAEYIFTAHYDTPGKTGWMLSTSKLFGMTGANIFFIIVCLAIAYFLPMLVGFYDGYFSDQGNAPLIELIGLECILLLLVAVLIISMTAKNKNNRNDNTSGVLSLLALAEKVSADTELRGKCCFVFFDNEEWGLLGSAGFAKYCRKSGININSSKIINFDCVGYGDVLTFVAKKSTPIAKSVTAAFAGAGMNPVFKKSKMIFLSDHANFKNSVMISYTKRSLIKLLYLPQIHTSKDTECDIDQINRLTDNFYEFAKAGKI